MEPMIQVENLCKSFSTKSGTVEAARNISFSIEKGEIFGIIGLSGAGKKYTGAMSEFTGKTDLRKRMGKW